MFDSDIDYFVRKERCKDLLREAECDRLIQQLERHRSGQRKLGRRVAGWFGSQMVKRGTKIAAAIVGHTHSRVGKW